MSSPVTTSLPLPHLVRLVLARLILGRPTAAAPTPTDAAWWDQRPGTS